MILLITAFTLCLWVYLLDFNDLVFKIFDCTYFIVIIATVVHSYTSSLKAKQIFVLVKKINYKFGETLMFNLDFAGHAAGIKNFFYKMLIFYLGWIATFLISTYFLDFQGLKFVCLKTYTSTVGFMVVFRFVFHLNVVTMNLKTVNKYLVSIVQSQKSPKHARPEYLKISAKNFSVLSEIYELCWEMATLANKISGPFLVFTFIFSIVYSSVSGYVVFLCILGKTDFGLKVIGNALFN